MPAAAGQLRGGLRKSSWRISEVRLNWRAATLSWCPNREAEKDEAILQDY